MPEIITAGILKMGRKPYPKDQKASHYHVTLSVEAAKIVDAIPKKQKSDYISKAVVKYEQLDNKDTP